MKNAAIWLLIIPLIMVTACLKHQPVEVLLYTNDFEPDIQPTPNERYKGFIDYVHNTSEKIFTFNGSNVLGRFATGGIVLRLDSLPEHDYVKIEFDFYVHDSWEGSGLRGNGEDVIIVNLDQTTLYFSSIINTKCITHNCSAAQSFPNIIGTGSPENSNVTDPTLPGVCFFEGEIGGSKRIHFDELRLHSARSLNLNIAADIKDAGEDLCFKSWSIDNIRITSMRIQDI